MNTRSTHPTETPFAFLWATFFTLFFLFLSGYGLISLIHFALEDALSLPISDFLATELFGVEYATFLSFGLILGVMFLVGDFYTRHRLRANPLLFKEPGRRAIFAAFFAVISYVFCADLILIFYGFFSGRTGPFGLWLSVSTLLLSALTLGYVYVQVYAFSFLTTRAFSVIVASFVALGMICGLWLTLHFAPPWIMAKADQDIKALTFLQKTLPEGLADYWRDYKALPQKLDDMILWKTVPSDIKHKITYTLDDPQKSTACIRLEVDAITARRLRAKTDLIDNQTDTMCQSFHFRENNTIPSIVVKHLWETDQSARPSLSTPPKD